MSALINACHSILVIWTLRTYHSRTFDADFVTVSELVVWCCITFLCASIENWVSELLRGKLTVEDIMQASRRLLSGFCDADVQLDPDLRIRQATPRLMHLISPESLTDPKALEGTLLSSHMALDLGGRPSSSRAHTPLEGAARPPSSSTGSRPGTRRRLARTTTQDTDPDDASVTLGSDEMKSTRV